MIAEFILGGGLLFYAGETLFKHFKAKPEDVPPLSASHTLVTTNPNVELLIELMKSEKGWKKQTMNYAHDLGVKIECDVEFPGHAYINFQIQDENGKWQIVNLSASDSKLVAREFQAFEDRIRDSKQRAIARVLAGRIVAAESGELRPVLGDERLPPPSGDDEPEVDCMGGTDSVSTYLLSYDEKTQQIVANFAGGAKRAVLDTNLLSRYELDRHKTEKNLAMYYDLFESHQPHESHGSLIW